MVGVLLVLGFIGYIGSMDDLINVGMEKEVYGLMMCIVYWVS